MNLPQVYFNRSSKKFLFFFKEVSCLQKINRNFPCFKHQSFTVLGSPRKKIIISISAFKVTVRLKTSIKEIKKLYKTEGLLV